MAHARPTDLNATLREAIAESRAAGFDAAAQELEARAFAAYATSSEQLGEAGEAITQFLGLAKHGLPPTALAKFRLCLAEIARVWPKYRP